MGLNEAQKKQYLEKLGAVRRAAIAEGCKEMKLFSQAVGPVQEALDAKGRGGGVCRELAIQWLWAKKAGTDYMATLLDVGGVVIDAALNKVIAEFDAYDKAKMNVLDQRKANVTRLKTKLKVPKECEFANADFRGEVIGKLTVSQWFGDLTVSEPYRFLAIRGGVDHALAVCLVPKKEAFFDPNLGEFDFKGQPDLVDFLEKQIFPPGKDAKEFGKYLGGTRSYTQIERICCS
jgi:hypothetical protein